MDLAGADGTRRSKTRATLVGCVLKRFTRNSKENTMSPMRERDESREFADKTFTTKNTERHPAPVHSLRWSRLSKQDLRFDRWSICQG